MRASPSLIGLLNFYRASQQHASLIIGQTARRSHDPSLILNLTRHSAEEMVHAQWWAETILRVGGKPAPTRSTYQSRYAEQVGAPRTVLDVMALTQVVERWLYCHFTLQLREPEVSDAIATTLSRVIEREKNHLTWVKAWLDSETNKHEMQLRNLLERYAAADKEIHQKLSSEFALSWAA